jgi:hypothetical protein
MSILPALSSRSIGNCNRSACDAFPVMLNRFVIARLDPAIHPFRKKMDARVKPAHDGGEQRFNSSGNPLW